MDDVREKIRFYAGQAGISLKELSMAAGRNHAYFQQYVQRGVPKKLSEEDRFFLAESFGIDEAELRAANLIKKSNREKIGLSNRGKEDYSSVAGKLQPIRVRGSKTLPLYGSQRSDSGDYVMDTSTNDFAYMPVYLEEVAGAYSLEMPDNSMEPQARPGDVLEIHPKKATRVGDLVVVRCKNGTFFVARLDAYAAGDDGEYSFTIYSPRSQREVKFADVERLEFVGGIQYVR